MEFLHTVKPITRTVIILSTLIPLFAYLYPQSMKYLYYDSSFLPFQFYRLYTGLFLTQFSINLLLALFVRFQILNNIENSNYMMDIANKTELSFFIFTLPIPLLIANVLEKMTTFYECFNVALVKFMCELSPREASIPFYGLSINVMYFPYFYLFLDLALSKFTSKSYYGFIYASVYIYARRNGCKVPDLFVNFLAKFENLYTIFLIETKRLFSGKRRGQARTGRKLASVPTL
ncbi:hypothetical protein COBT_000567 [Conglomerata obtusa]